ncbi:hypothetical protein MYAER_2747 [Microcystis aeruginosa NIES-2549]|uniref:Uncharacterized protein n=1 Tax=Microcystis aeruginosa NIES-2549 TaxID=1641812 RepID=A0A0F6U5F5_MICAE|nr:hypothetical protein MYAER_2747 [Microcystis aeruginosa NIES-2549]AOC53492.1 hypothetical protein amyaer_2783 [Microcystis aeruginosa NIES-2481]
MTKNIDKTLYNRLKQRYLTKSGGIGFWIEFTKRQDLVP